MWERLDRAVSMAEWFDLFPVTKVHTLVCVSSDHNLIIILPDGFGVKPQRTWRFEQMWLENEGCHDIVVGAWNRASSSSPMETMVTKIEACQKRLTQWSKHSFCNVSGVLSKKKKLLKEAEVATARGKKVEVFL